MDDNLSQIPDDDEDTPKFEVFDISSNYYINDWVIHNGMVYSALRDNEGEYPDQNPDAWYPLVLNTEYTINAGYINSGYSTITTGNTGFNYMYANGAANLHVSNEIYELRETVRQLRREIDEIKRQLNTVQESKNVESHRKIAVQ